MQLIFKLISISSSATTSGGERLPLSVLPSDVLLSMLPFLQPSDLGSLSETCQIFSDLIYLHAFEYPVKQMRLVTDFGELFQGCASRTGRLELYKECMTGLSFDPKKTPVDQLTQTLAFLLEQYHKYLNSKIQSLSLGHHLQNAQLAEVGASLGKGNFPNLSELEVSGNLFSGTAFSGFLKNMSLRVASPVRIFRCNRNWINSEAVQAFVSAIKAGVFDSLVELGLQHNHFSSEDLSSMLEAFGLRGGALSKLSVGEVWRKSSPVKKTVLMPLPLPGRVQTSGVPMPPPLPVLSGPPPLPGSAPPPLPVPSIRSVNSDVMLKLAEVIGSGGFSKLEEMSIFSGEFSTESFEAFVTALQSSGVQLNKLSLSSSTLSIEHLGVLANAMAPEKPLHGLEVLDLSDCKVESAGFELIVEQWIDNNNRSAAKPSPLRELIVPGNMIQQTCFERLFSKIDSLPCLEKLDMSNNIIEMDGVRHCGFGIRALEALAIAVKHGRLLRFRSLVLISNPTINDGALCEFASALETGRSPEFRELNFCMSRATNMAAIRLATGINAGCPKFERLVFQLNNDVSFEALKTMSETLFEISTLQRLLFYTGPSDRTGDKAQATLYDKLEGFNQRKTKTL